MTDKRVADCPEAYRWWSQAVTSLALSPWRLLDAQCEAGIKMLDTLLGVRPARATAPEGKGPLARGDFTELEHAAAERVRGGKAPPREVYEVQNRGRIDWSQFPDWARPSDPEMFEGSAHEG